jgi:hypothetical protein
MCWTPLYLDIPISPYFDDSITMGDSYQQILELFCVGFTRRKDLW